MIKSCDPKLKGDEKNESRNSTTILCVAVSKR